VVTVEDLNQVLIQALVQRMEQLQTTTEKMQASQARKDEIFLETIQRLTDHCTTTAAGGDTRLMARPASQLAANAADQKDPTLCHFIDRELGVTCDNPKDMGGLFCSLHGNRDCDTSRCRHLSNGTRRCYNQAGRGQTLCGKHNSVGVNKKKCQSLTAKGRQCQGAPVKGRIFCGNHLEAKGK
jgi:hypothetical protein